MPLSAPVHLLKRQAKALARQARIPLHQALNQIAKREGYNAWSLLAARATDPKLGQDLLAQLDPGELVLLGARPGQGKTLLSLELSVAAMQAGHRAYFFTLEYTEADLADCFTRINVDAKPYADRFVFDNSDAICASYIMQQLASEPAGTLAIVDYLQLLDQKREHPNLQTQVHALKAFAQDRGLTLVFISQIDRRFETSQDQMPTLADVRLPNPLALSLFNKTCFLNQGDMQVAAIA
jgi:replicative DNA helicase